MLFYFLLNRRFLRHTYSTQVSDFFCYRYLF